MTLSQKITRCYPFVHVSPENPIYATQTCIVGLFGSSSPHVCPTAKTQRRAVELNVSANYKFSSTGQGN